MPQKRAAQLKWKDGACNEIAMIKTHGENKLCTCKSEIKQQNNSYKSSGLQAESD